MELQFPYRPSCHTKFRSRVWPPWRGVSKTPTRFASTTLPLSSSPSPFSLTPLQATGATHLLTSLLDDLREEPVKKCILDLVRFRWLFWRTWRNIARSSTLYPLLPLEHPRSPRMRRARWADGCTPARTSRIPTSRISAARSHIYERVVYLVSSCKRA